MKKLLASLLLVFATVASAIVDDNGNEVLRKAATPIGGGNYALFVQSANAAILDAIAALSGTGIMVKDGAETVTTRTITGTASQITVTNGDGVAGNPTLSLPTTAVAAGTYAYPSSLTVDAQGRLTAASAGVAFPADPTLISVLFEDWISNTEFGVLGWTSTNSGAGSAPTASGAGSEAFNRGQGSASIQTGTTATGRSALGLGATMGIGYTTIAQQWRLLIVTLSTGAEEFDVFIGLGDTPAGAGIAQTNAVGLVYDRDVSINWICQTVAGGAATNTTSSIAVVNTAFTKLRIEINSAGTSAAMYVNGVLACTNTTNIPGFTQFVGPLAKISKSVGTTSRNAIIDYFWQRIDWGTAR